MPYSFIVGLFLWKSGFVTPSTLPEKRYDWIDYAAQLLAEHHTDFYPFLLLVFVINLALVNIQRSFPARWAIVSWGSSW